MTACFSNQFFPIHVGCLNLVPRTFLAIKEQGNAVFFPKDWWLWVTWAPGQGCERRCGEGALMSCHSSLCAEAL